MSFEYNGLHLMIDATVREPKKLVEPSVGEALIEGIVRKIDMTMILPPVTVKFPHAICEMTKLLQELRDEGLGNSKAAKGLELKLAERNNESYGYSTFAMIAESHLSIHTFPELEYFSFDCYSCKTFDIQAVVNTINQHFEIKSIDIQSCARRIPNDG